MQYLAKFGLPPVGGNSIDASAVSKIGDRVAALVAREAQAFVPMIPPPLFVGKARLWTRHILLIVPLS